MDPIASDAAAPLSPFRLGGLTGDHPPIQAPGFGFTVAVCFTINYIMGTGFLTLPFAAAKAGWLLALLGLFTMALLANIAKDYILETSARAELIEDPSCYPELGLDVLSASNGGVLQRNNTSSQQMPLLLTVKTKKYEMPVLCRRFMGKTGRLLYLVFLSIYIYGALLAYTSVFSKSLASSYPIPHVQDSYAIYLVLFACMVVPLSCLELTEQITVQVTLSACRFLMVIFMVGTVLAAYTDSKDSFSNQVGARGIPAWDFSGLYVFLPIACYAFIYHHSIAGLSHPVRDKKTLGSIFLLTFVICSLAYGCIAVLVANYFGQDMAQSSNLEWDGYGRNSFTKAISYYILLFPALDVASAFPLNAITLGNNMLAMKDDEGQSEPHSRGTIIFFRLLASVPPLVVGFFLRDLGKISEYSGTVGVIITLIFPAILNLRSRAVMKEVFGLESAKTFYSTELSRKRYGPVNLLIGVTLFFYIFINLLLE